MGAHLDVYPEESKLTYCRGGAHLDVCPEESKLAYYRGGCTSGFTTAQFTVAEVWNHPVCSSAAERIKQMWCRYRIKVHSATRKNRIVCPLQENGWGWRLSLK